MPHDYRQGPVLEEVARAAVPSRGWIKGYVNWASTATDANLAYHILGGLVALGQTVPINYTVPFGMPIATPIFALLIGASTDARKSRAIELCDHIVSQSTPKRVGIAPGSAEAVIDELEHNNQQVVFISEYAAFLAQTERGYANAIKTRWTQAYDGQRIGRVKANKKQISVETPRLTVFAGCAPGYVEKHTEPVDWSEGFFARHTVVVAKRERYIKTPQPDDARRVQLIDYAKTLAATDAFTGEGLGPCAGFTPDAMAVRSEWEDRLRELQIEYNHLVNLPALGRAPVMAIKIAALIAWDWGYSRRGMEWRIDDEIMLAAIRIVDLHVQSTIMLGEWLAPTDAMRDRRRVLAMINAHPIRRGALIRKAQLLKREADWILGTLVEEGTIKVAHTHNGEPYYSVVPEEDRPPDVLDLSLLSNIPEVDPNDYN